MYLEKTEYEQLIECERLKKEYYLLEYKRLQSEFNVLKHVHFKVVNDYADYKTKINKCIILEGK